MSGPAFGIPSLAVRWLGAMFAVLATYNPSASNKKGPAGMLYIISDNAFVSPNSVPGRSMPESDLVHSVLPRPDDGRAVSRDVISQESGGNNR